MGVPQSERTIVALERDVLNSLFTAVRSPEEVNRAIKALSGYRWLDPEHDTVFRAVERIARSPHADWREELPAQATRMGFPDVDWSGYFEAKSQRGCAQADLDALIARLANTKR